MDDYLDLLIDPIEFPKISDEDQMADEYRPWPFNLKLGSVLVADPVQMSVETLTPLEYWKPEFDIKNHLLKLMDDFSSMPEHSLAKHLALNQELDTELEAYYNKVYDMADIVFCRIINQTCNMNVITALCRAARAPNTIIYRIIIYLMARVIKTYPRICKPQVLIDKMLQFKTESTIEDYFTTRELENYVAYATRLNS